MPLFSTLKLITALSLQVHFDTKKLFVKYRPRGVGSIQNSKRPQKVVRQWLCPTTTQPQNNRLFMVRVSSTLVILVRSEVICVGLVYILL